jgi:hypothetical protein
MGKGKGKHVCLPQFKVEKRTAVREAPDPKKVVHQEEHPWARTNPSWRFRQIDLCDPFGWHHLGHETYVGILAKLTAFESMTWSEILIGANKQNHQVEVWKLEKAAQDRLKEAGYPEIEELVSLHLGGKQRVWGKMQGTVLHILWWDPDHQVCWSTLKHT